MWPLAPACSRATEGIKEIEGQKTAKANKDFLEGFGLATSGNVEAQAKRLAAAFADEKVHILEDELTSLVKNYTQSEKVKSKIAALGKQAEASGRPTSKHCFRCVCLLFF